MDILYNVYWCITPVEIWGLNKSISLIKVWHDRGPPGRTTRLLVVFTTEHLVAVLCHHFNSTEKLIALSADRFFQENKNKIKNKKHLTKHILSSTHLECHIKVFFNVTWTLSYPLINSLKLESNWIFQVYLATFGDISKA